jgi:hypothetical protein
MTVRRALTAWVAPNGSDSADGTQASPFESLGRAVYWLEEQRRQDSASDIVILVRSGTYRLRKPLVIRRDSCGSGGARTVIRGEHRNQTILTGNEIVSAQPMSSWTGCGLAELAAASKARRWGWIDIPQREGVSTELGLLGFLAPIPHAPPMVFHNGKRLYVSRWPAKPTLTGKVVHVLPRSPGGSGRGYESDSVTIDIDQPLAPLRRSDELWVEAVIRNPWRWYQGRVASLDIVGRRITVDLIRNAAAEGDAVTQIGFFNAQAGMANPGHFTFDTRARRAVFSVSLDNERHSETDIGIEGSDPEVECCAHPAPLVQLVDANNVELSDLTLEGGLASAVVMNGCHTVHVRDCTIRNFGFGGIEAEGAGIEISRCKIHNVGRAGVYMWSGNESSLESGNSSIRSCTFQDWAQWNRVYEPAARVFGVGTLVSENHFSDGPHMAIELTGNDHVVERNTFTRVARDFSDMGAIYLNQGEHPLRRGIIIVANLFHDLGQAMPDTHAVYIDRATFGVTVRNNLFLRVGADRDWRSVAVFANGASDLSVESNLFVDCRKVFDFSFYLSAWGKLDRTVMQRGWERTIAALSDDSLPHHSRYPELAGFANEDRIFPRSNAFSSNLVLTANQKADPSSCWDVRYGGDDLINLEGNIVVSDPTTLSAPPGSVALLIAGRSHGDVKKLLQEVLKDWPAAARQLYRQAPSRS